MPKITVFFSHAVLVGVHQRVTAHVETNKARNRHLVQSNSLRSYAHSREAPHVDALIAEHRGAVMPACPPC